MFRILYFSIATQPMSQNDLRNLLSQARVRNENESVTGMLVYNGGQFLQALEGDASSVIAAFERIRNDPRHTQITVLQREQSYGGRLFPDWSMGCKVIDGGIGGAFSINARINLSSLDALSGLDFLSECAVSQNLKV